MKVGSLVRCGSKAGPDVGVVLKISKKVVFGEDRLITVLFNRAGKKQTLMNSVEVLDVGEN